MPHSDIWADIRLCRWCRLFRATTQGPLLVFHAVVGAAVAFLVVATPFGCGSEGGGHDEDQQRIPFDCTLGALNDDGEFETIDELARTELHLGFQGFLLTALHVRANAPPPDGPFRATISAVWLQDGDITAPVSAEQPKVTFNAGSIGAVSDELLLFFNTGLISELKGKQVQLVVRLRSNTHECICQGVALLVDDDPCIHTGAEPICPDGGEAATAPEEP